MRTIKTYFKGRPFIMRFSGVGELPASAATVRFLVTLPIYAGSMTEKLEIRLFAPRVLGTGFLILMVSLGFTAGCRSYRVTQDWELPSGYHGWVLVERANSKCPPAALTFTSVTLKVDSSGHGCTSTTIFPQYLRIFELDSLRHRRKLRMGSPGKGGQIWEFSTASEGSESDFYAAEFFVGTETEYQSGREISPKWWLAHRPDGSASR
jgi:hypothetical protein